MLYSLDIFVSDTSIARNLHLPSEILQLHQDPRSFLWIRFRHLCCSKTGNIHLRITGPYHHRGKRISALVNDWENNIACGKNPSKARLWLLASAIRFMLYVDSQLMGLGGTAKAGTFFNLYCHLCLETVFPGLKLTQNCYLHYNINIFS